MYYNTLQKLIRMKVVLLPKKFNFKKGIILKKN